MWKWIAGIFGVLVALVVIAALGALGYRAVRQWENARALAITTRNGIDEAAFVRIGGIDQWVTIRGRDRDNPVILFLHGGPGSAISTVAAPVFRNWEKDFTVVQWDQRGSGRTYGLNGEDEKPMTVDRMVKDGIELSQYLIVHLHKRKIILLGLSWGSELGVMMVKREPGLYFAYVGTGQVVAKEEKEEIIYARLMERLKKAHDADGIAKLKEIGPPPYESEAELAVERNVQNRFEVSMERDQFQTMLPHALYAPHTSIQDLLDVGRGQEFAGEALYRELLAYDARKLGRHFDVPIFIVNGDHDLTTPADLAKAWFDTLDAPQKEFVLLKGGGHSAVMTMPDVFLRELVARVRPIAIKS